MLRGAVAATTPLSVDEAYYWQWTRPLELSYYDHPAMVAYWIWTGIHLIGENELGVRLLAVVGSCAVTALAWDAARLAFASRRVGALTAFWLNGAALFDISGTIMTPDSPLLLFWSLCLWALIRLVAEQRPRYLYVAGLALGLGAISKYTMVLLVPAVLAVFVLFPALRRWWRSPHPYLAALLGLISMTPLLLWNLENQGASFTKQLDHAFAADTPHRLANLGDFLASQVGLVTPLIFAFCLWGMGWALWAGWRRQRADWFLLGASSLPVFLFFLQHTLGGLVQAHWAGPAYLGGVMAAVGGWSTAGDRPQRAFRAAPFVGVAVTLLVFLQASTAILPIPVRVDPLKRLGGWRELAAAVDAERTASPGAFLFTEKHQPTGVVSFYLPDHPPVFLQGHIRPSYYTAADVAALKGKNGLFITRSNSNAARDIAKYFADVVFRRRVVLRWGGRPADSYDLYLATDYRGGAFVMGDGLDAARDDP